MLDGQLPPHDPAAEQAVLGSLLIDSDAIHDIRPFLKPEDFFSPEHQWIYGACLDIISRGEPINQITVARQLADKGRLDEVGGAAYLSHLISITPTSLHAKSFGQIVKNTAVRRRAISAGSQISAIAYEEPDPKVVISRSEEILLRLQKDVALPHLITPIDLATMGQERYDQLARGNIPGVYTGFSDLDWLTGGIFGGEYWLVGARPGLGKTTILLGIAQNISKNHGNVLMVSLEEDWGMILDRLISERTGKHPRIIRKGSYSDDLYGEIIFHLGDIAEQNIYFYDSGSSLYDESATTPLIFSMATHMKLSYGLSAIFIDYIGLLSDEYGKSSYERISRISRRIKILARTLQVPVICACQLSRQVEYQEDKRPSLHDLRDSGGLEQDADVVLFLYRDSYYQDKRVDDINNPDYNMNKAELLIAKQRQGGGQEKFVPLRWDAEHFRYVGEEK